MYCFSSMVAYLSSSFITWPSLIIFIFGSSLKSILILSAVGLLLPYVDYLVIASSFSRVKSMLLAKLFEELNVSLVF